MTKLAHVADRARSRFECWMRLLSSHVHSFKQNAAARNQRALDDIDARYRITRFRTMTHRVVGLLPPTWREGVAERFLRRAGAPGPAAEHVVQYLLCAARSKRKQCGTPEAVAKCADNFYTTQYRQYFNPAMGAFAMTATRALLATGGAPRGLLWRRRRKTYAAMLEETAGAPPILVIDHQTVAVALLLPKPRGQLSHDAVARWLLGRRPMPSCYRELVEGEEISCAEPNVRSRERCRDGALLEVADNVIQSRKLALLALHPHDPDAMGLHITLFAAQMLEPWRLEREYGLDPDVLAGCREAASQTERLLVFCVGGSEEVFTQCSQNLFIKRPVASQAGRARPLWPNAWSPALSLERLLDAQFETLQATVSASALPGASPRNGDRGKTAFVGRRGRNAFILIPYHPGNSVHGHAAKLWSNPYGSLVIFDDHSALTAITISGPARVVAHEDVKRDFPAIAREGVAGRTRKGKSAPDPEYWYVQEIAELVQQSEPLAAHSLDPARPTCSISAAGDPHYDKKPAYFAANTLAPYDQILQHEREAAGRLVDPTGKEHRRWTEMVRSALDARRAHLQLALGDAQESHAGGQNE